MTCGWYEDRLTYLDLYTDNFTGIQRDSQEKVYPIASLFSVLCGNSMGQVMRQGVMMHQQHQPWVAPPAAAADGTQDWRAAIYTHTDTPSHACKHTCKQNCKYTVNTYSEITQWLYFYSDFYWIEKQYMPHPNHHMQSTAPYGLFKSALCSYS